MIRRTACLIALGGEPYRNLAIEKHLMDTLPEDTAILYLWQNDRCISIGRCQNPLYECRVDPFLSAGGHIARRLSGGGAVYQDRGALNFSFILPKTAFDIHHQLSILGMAAGAALGAVGVMAATQNQRQLRRTTRKVVKGAENAVLQLDKMVGDFVEKHMEG